MLKWLENFRKTSRSRRLSMIFGFMIFVGLILVALGIMATIKVTPYATYTNKKEGFSIQFPAYWKYLPQPATGSVIAFMAPKDSELDYIQENVNVTIKVLNTEMTMERLSKVIASQITGTFGEQVDVTEMMPITLGGRKGYRMAFAGYGENIANPLLYVTAWTAIKEKVFIITFVGLQKDYPLYQKKVDQIIRSFKFIPVETR